MAKAVVTQARVFEVAQALTDQGTAPTILNVQEEIGGGSYTTVKRYLDSGGRRRRSSGSRWNCRNPRLPG
jgi:hypothetical protein